VRLRHLEKKEQGDDGGGDHASPPPGPGGADEENGGDDGGGDAVWGMSTVSVMPNAIADGEQQLVGVHRCLLSAVDQREVCPFSRGVG
jgi:hypothetical protein